MIKRYLGPPTWKAAFPYQHGDHGNAAAAVRRRAVKAECLARAADTCLRYLGERRWQSKEGVAGRTKLVMGGSKSEMGQRAGERGRLTREEEVACRQVYKRKAE
eukprot:4228268-Pleurochrysis_carterae.AAC.2